MSFVIPYLITSTLLHENMNLVNMRCDLNDLDKGMSIKREIQKLFFLFLQVG